MSSTLCGPVCKSKGCKTEIRFDEVSYVWTIADFHFHEVKGEKLSSSEFSSTTNDQFKWYLTLHPNGRSDAKNYISLFLHLSDLGTFVKTKKMFIELDLFILNSAGKEDYHIKPAVKEFPLDVKMAGLGVDKFSKKDGNFRNHALSNNTLTICCKVKFSDMNDVTRSSHQCNCGIQVPEFNLSSNLVALFENQELMDVVLSVNGKEYPAHKIVLAASSPVFRAMFKHSLKEKELNRVDIEDINEAVVEEMLKYIYTGKCEVPDELAEGLLAAADKYELCRLKMMCAKTLFERLSVDNAANVLALADMHGVKELKDKVIKFIASKPTEVLRTEGWKNIRLNFELADQVCLAIAER
ncbi:speckle-type POZ protein B-like [Planococcus citri]|uniref:speckle-type POZ protein B-like n=1 Tax=Planococcus citri TaxID=170843 RepID=UPI0031F75974